MYVCACVCPCVRAQVVHDENWRTGPQFQSKENNFEFLDIQSNEPEQGIGIEELRRKKTPEVSPRLANIMRLL